jgi:hypothetical protein
MPKFRGKMSIYLNTVITSGSKVLFELPDDDFFILSEFGKIGETYRRKINIGRLEQRQISRRCDVLYEKGFLHLIKSTPYQNQSHKKIKTFGLSLKGFLSSCYVRQSNLNNNYYFKKYISLFPSDLQKPVKQFLTLHIAEFLLYHKSLKLQIKNLDNLSLYIRNIIYDYDLILNHDDKIKLEKIHNDMVIIDDIRDIISEYKILDGEEPSDVSFSHLGLDDFEISFIDDELESGKNYPTKEHIKYEFLINYWPYVIDELGKGTDVECELENISDDAPPFGLSEYGEDFKEFAAHKRSMIMSQWQLRKLDFLKSYDMSF